MVTRHEMDVPAVVEIGAIDYRVKESDLLIILEINYNKDTLFSLRPLKARIRGWLPRIARSSALILILSRLPGTHRYLRTIKLLIRLIKLPLPQLIILELLGE